jgi:hypothetical protein
MAQTEKEAEEEKQEEPTLEDVAIGEDDGAENGVEANEPTDEREDDDVKAEEESGGKKKKKHHMKVAADAPWKDRMWEGV